jgi:hypothetical protein
METELPSGLISIVLDIVKYDAAIDRGAIYSAQAQHQIRTPAASPTGQRFPYGLGWFVQDYSARKYRLLWHYGWYQDAFSSLLFKIPERQLTFILRASSVFLLGKWRPDAFSIRDGIRGYLRPVAVRPLCEPCKRRACQAAARGLSPFSI